MIALICLLTFAAMIGHGQTPEQANRNQPHPEPRGTINGIDLPAATNPIGPTGRIPMPNSAQSPIGRTTQPTAVRPMVASSKPAVPQLPRIPREAVAVALADMRTLPAAIQQQRIYVWIPDGGHDGANIARLDTNIAISHSPVDYAAGAISGGALLPLDLAALCPDQKDFDNVQAIRLKLGASNPYFCEAVLLSDGTIGHRPATHLGPAGIELERLAGNEYWDRQSFSPIVEVNWFNRIALSSTFNGLYLEFRGIKPGKTKLSDYLVSRGVDRKFIEKANSDDRIALHSRVTGRARGINFYSSMGVKPSFGSSLVAVTDDNREEDQDTNQNPLYALLHHKPFAHESILTQKNGWPEFGIWDQNELALAEAASSVVTDSRVPPPFPARLQGALCIRCHSDPKEDGWKPAENEVLALQADAGFTLSTSDLTRLTSLYRGDPALALQLARDNLDRRCFAVSGTGATALLQSASTAYNAYEYAWLDSKRAVGELGGIIGADDAIGNLTFGRMVNILPLPAADDPILRLLSADRLDLVTAKRKGYQVTRDEFEQVYSAAELRALPQLQGTKK